MKIYPYEDAELKIHPHTCKTCSLNEECKGSLKDKNKCVIMNNTNS